MTVAELIERLGAMDPDAAVHIGYDFGDYGRTTVAPAIRTVDEEAVVRSDYHQMDRVLDEDVIDSYPHARQVVVLR